MNNIKKTKKAIFFILIVLVAASYFSSLKNIDLAYNIDTINRTKVVDNNGIMVQNINDMYAKSYFYLWIIPIIITIISVLCYLNNFFI